MLLIKTETCPGKECFRLKRAVQLAFFLKAKTDIIFSISGQKIPENLLTKGKFPFPVYTASENIQNLQVSAILFDKDRMDNEDLSLINYAKKNKIKIIKFAEAGNEQAEADLFINPVIKREYTSTAGKNNLTGPEYTILHHKYIHFNRIKRKYRKKIKNILLVPVDYLDYREIKSLADILSRHGFNIKIVPGKNLKKFNRKTLKRIYPQVRFTGKIESLARPFFESDIALITPDISAYEAAAVGTPAFYLVKNEEMKFKSEIFEEKGMGIKFPYGKNIDEKVLIDLIRSLSFEKRLKMGESGREIIDGKGIYRITDFLITNNFV